MAEVTVQLQQLPMLQSLIFGFRTPQGEIVKGIVSQNLTEGKKYKLRAIGKIVEAEAKNFTDRVNELKGERTFESVEAYMKKLEEKDPEVLELDNKLKELSETQIILTVNLIPFDIEMQNARFPEGNDYSQLYDLFFVMPE